MVTKKELFREIADLYGRPIVEKATEEYKLHLIEFARRIFWNLATEDTLTAITIEAQLFHKIQDLKPKVKS